jgi:multidrug efflux pump subunit AcrA (membrane-fusion protein)
MINKLISIFIFQFIFLLENVIAENKPFQAIVQIEEVINIEISPSVWVSGNVISQYDSKISSEVEGRIINILEIGDYVKTGDIIGRIENTRYQLNYAEIQAEIQSILYK